MKTTMMRVMTMMEIQIRMIKRSITWTYMDAPKMSTKLTPHYAEYA